jgi:hypothetical protein
MFEPERAEMQAGIYLSFTIRLKRSRTIRQGRISSKSKTKVDIGWGYYMMSKAMDLEISEKQ